MATTKERQLNNLHNRIENHLAGNLKKGTFTRTEASKLAAEYISGLVQIGYSNEEVVKSSKQFYANLLKRKELNLTDAQIQSTLDSFSKALDERFAPKQEAKPAEEKPAQAQPTQAKPAQQKTPPQKVDPRKHDNLKNKIGRHLTDHLKKGTFNQGVASSLADEYVSGMIEIGYNDTTVKNASRQFYENLLKMKELGLSQEQINAELGKFNQNVADRLAELHPAEEPMKNTEPANKPEEKIDESSLIYEKLADPVADYSPSYGENQYEYDATPEPMETYILSEEKDNSKFQDKLDKLDQLDNEVAATENLDVEKAKEFANRYREIQRQNTGEGAEDTVNAMTNQWLLDIYRGRLKLSTVEINREMSKFDSNWKPLQDPPLTPEQRRQELIKLSSEFIIDAQNNGKFTLEFMRGHEARYESLLRRGTLRENGQVDYLTEEKINQYLYNDYLSTLKGVNDPRRLTQAEIDAEMEAYNPAWKREPKVEEPKAVEKTHLTYDEYVEKVAELEHEVNATENLDADKAREFGNRYKELTRQQAREDYPETLITEAADGWLLNVMTSKLNLTPAQIDEEMVKFDPNWAPVAEVAEVHENAEPEAEEEIHAEFQNRPGYGYNITDPEASSLETVVLDEDGTTHSETTETERNSYESSATGDEFVYGNTWASAAAPFAAAYEEEGPETSKIFDTKLTAGRKGSRLDPQTNETGRSSVTQSVEFRPFPGYEYEKKTTTYTVHEFDNTDEIARVSGLATFNLNPTTNKVEMTLTPECVDILKKTNPAIAVEANKPIELSSLQLSDAGIGITVDSDSPELSATGESLSLLFNPLYLNARDKSGNTAQAMLTTPDSETTLSPHGFEFTGMGIRTFMAGKNGCSCTAGDALRSNLIVMDLTASRNSFRALGHENQIMDTKNDAFWGYSVPVQGLSNINDPTQISYLNMMRVDGKSYAYLHLRKDETDNRTTTTPRSYEIKGLFFEEMPNSDTSGSNDPNSLVSMTLDIGKGKSVQYVSIPMTRAQAFEFIREMGNSEICQNLPEEQKRDLVEMQHVLENVPDINSHAIHETFNSILINNNDTARKYNAYVRSYDNVANLIAKPFETDIENKKEIRNDLDDDIYNIYDTSTSVSMPYGPEKPRDTRPVAPPTVDDEPVIEEPTAEEPTETNGIADVHTSKHMEKQELEKEKDPIPGERQLSLALGFVFAGLSCLCPPLAIASFASFAYCTLSTIGARNFGVRRRNAKKQKLNDYIDSIDPQKNAQKVAEAQEEMANINQKLAELEGSNLSTRKKNKQRKKLMKQLQAQQNEIERAQLRSQIYEQCGSFPSVKAYDAEIEKVHAERAKIEGRIAEIDNNVSKNKNSLQKLIDEGVINEDEANAYQTALVEAARNQRGFKNGSDEVMPFDDPDVKHDFEENTKTLTEQRDNMFETVVNKSKLKPEEKQRLIDGYRDRANLDEDALKEYNKLYDHLMKTSPLAKTWQQVNEATETVLKENAKQIQALEEVSAREDQLDAERDRLIELNQQIKEVGKTPAPEPLVPHGPSAAPLEEYYYEPEETNEAEETYEAGEVHEDKGKGKNKEAGRGGK